MANFDPPQTPTPEAAAEVQRQELQGILGEYHGLLTTIVQELLQEVPDEEMTDLIGDIRNAFPGVSVAFGEVQGKLNTGGHDDGIDDVALSSEQLKPKKRGLRFNYRRFYRAMAGRQESPRRFDLVRTLKHALHSVKWGNVIVGSLSKELGKSKGIEVIKEFGEIVVTTLEQIIDNKESKDSNET
jgi:hypothetical protein